MSSKAKLITTLNFPEDVLCHEVNVAIDDTAKLWGDSDPSVGVGVSKRFSLSHIDRGAQTLLNLGACQVIDVVDDVIDEPKDDTLGFMTSIT